MSRELAKLAFRLQKAFAPSVHVLVPKILFTMVVSQIAKDKEDAISACRELFKQGVWAGSIAATHLASSASLKRFWPEKPDPRAVADYTEVLGCALWQIFVGRTPRARTAVLDEKGLAWVEFEEAPGEDAFYKIIAPSDVNTVFFVAGMLEGAFQTVFRIVEAEAEWFSMWRPLDGEGVCGFLAKRSLSPTDVEREIESRRPGFFRIVDWGQSLALARDLIGSTIP